MGSKRKRGDGEGVAVKVDSDREGEEQLSGEKAAHQHAQSAPHPQQCTTHACMAA